MKIYISGKISKLVLLPNGKEDKVNSLKQAKFNFDYAIGQLVGRTMALRENIVNPLDLKPFLFIKCWLFFMITDISALSKCTHIAMQPNWKFSKGAVIEYFFALFIFKLKIIWL